MPSPKNSVDKSRKKRPPATSPEARENQLIALAYDLAEKQLSEGTATSQVITQFLKGGSVRDRLEKERLQEENKLLRAKTEALQSSKKNDELYERVLKAMSTYRGRSDEDDY